MMVSNRPVLISEYREFVDAGGDPDWPGPPTDWPYPAWGWTDEYPAVNVDYDHAVAYCEWRTARGQPCRLPTEHEWEATARGRAWQLGTDPDYPHVSVWEWVDTPRVPRVVRGGSWCDDYVGDQPDRWTHKCYSDPHRRRVTIGFRVVAS